MGKYIENSPSEENESFELRTEIEKYLVYWKWFLLSIIICVGSAVFYAKSQVNIYQTNASLLVKEEDGVASELQAFQDLSSLGLGKNNNVLDEVEILSSRSLLVAFIKELNLNLEIYKKSGLKNIEQFVNKPVNFQVLSDSEKFYQLDTFLDITLLDSYKFSYKLEGEKEEKTIKFGEKIKIGDYELLFTPNYKNLEEGDNNYHIVFHDLDKIIEFYQKKITVNSVDTQSNIINIGIKHPIKEKGQLILNTMINLYNQMSIDDENLVGKKTDAFIEERLDNVKAELDQVDKIEELYKTNKKITDIQLQARVFLDGKSLNDQEIFKKNALLSVVNFMIENIEEQKNNFELLPTSIGVEENLQLSASVSNYNQLLLERNRLVRTSSLSNPVVQNLNVELLNLRDNIKISLNNTKKQLEIGVQSLMLKEKEFDKEISSMPERVREYRTIIRRQEIIAQLYSYLLQKKEENKISMAVTVSNTKIIDRAYSNNRPIAPKKIIIALVGLILGLLIPFSVIYILEVLDTKFHSRSELEKYVSVPILGDIPFDKSEEKVVIKQGSRTSSAEAFRLLRTNLDFMLSGVNTSSKVIFVTSTISGEGKTFISVNVASSMALKGKKVLLIGMDLRAPKITQYLGLPNRSGVSNYLINSKESLKEMIFSLDGFENLDVLSSGIVPPNPAELLLNPRIKEMFLELRSLYDYIVVDTAPVNLVTDTLMISEFADMFLYVARAGYIDKRMLNTSQKLYKEKRLPNMAMIINGMNYSRSYGYGYGGYGYPSAEGHRNIFQKIFKI